MRNQHQRRTAADKLVFQPLDRRQIEMVRRFVEKQNVGFRRKHTGKGGTTRLAAGKARRLFLPGQPQMLQQVGDPVGIVAWSEAGFRIGLDRIEAVEIGRLVEIAYRHRWMPEDLARLGFCKPGGDLHQRRFARTVAADEADAIARLDLQARTREQRRAAEGQ